MKAPASYAVLLGAVIGWFGFAMAGWAGLVWGACVVLAFVAFAGRYGLGRPPVAGARAGEEPVNRVGRYPQYERLHTQLGWALRDGRYFANVLAPQLRRLARQVATHRRGRDITDERLATELGPQVWRLIVAEPWTRDRDDRPSSAEVAHIVSAIEEL